MTACVKPEDDEFTDDGWMLLDELDVLLDEDVAFPAVAELVLDCGALALPGIVAALTMLRSPTAATEAKAVA